MNIDTGHDLGALGGDLAWRYRDQVRPLDQLLSIFSEGVKEVAAGDWWRGEDPEEGHATTLGTGGV